MNTLMDERLQELEELRTKYILGEVSVDPDDPHTTATFSDEEIAYIRGEDERLCSLCGLYCRCDQDFEQQRDLGEIVRNGGP